MSLKEELQKINGNEMAIAFEEALVRDVASPELMTATIMAVREHYPGLYELSERIGEIAVKSQQAAAETDFEEPVDAEDFATGALYFALGLKEYAETEELRQRFLE